MTAMIDTQAPERIWVTGEYSIWPTFRSFNASDLDHRNDDGTSDYPEYERRDLADARAAAAWIAGRDAAIGAYTENWETGSGHALHGQEAAEALPLPDTTALDRLIAERVREAVEAALAAVYEADSLELAQHGTTKIAERIEAQIAARGSKEGRDG